MHDVFRASLQSESLHSVELEGSLEMRLSLVNAFLQVKCIITKRKHGDGSHLFRVVQQTDRFSQDLQTGTIALQQIAHMTAAGNTFFLDRT